MAKYMTVSKIRTESNKRKGWKNILHFLCAENQNQWISKIICLDLEKHTTPYIPNTLSLKSKNSKCLKPPVATDEGWTEGPDSKLSSRIQILSYFHFHPSYSQLKIKKKISHNVSILLSLFPLTPTPHSSVPSYLSSPLIDVIFLHRFA